MNPNPAELWAPPWSALWGPCTQSTHRPCVSTSLLLWVPMQSFLAAHSISSHSDKPGAAARGWCGSSAGGWGSLGRGVPTHGARPRLRDPVSTARNGTQGWRGNTCLSQRVLLALPISPGKIHRHIAFPSSQMDDAPGPRVHHKTGTPTPCLAQEPITLKEKEGERGRKTLSAYLRV